MNVHTHVHTHIYTPYTSLLAVKVMEGVQKVVGEEKASAILPSCKDYELCTYLYNNGLTIIGETNHFLLGFKVHPTGNYYYSCLVL